MVFIAELFGNGLNPLLIGAHCERANHRVPELRRLNPLLIGAHCEPETMAITREELVSIPYSSGLIVNVVWG